MLMQIPFAIYDYCFKKKIETPGQLTSSLTQYQIFAFQTDSGLPIEYLYNIYAFNQDLMITDIFPAQWEGEQDCFQKLTSLQGMPVNMKKISLTCLGIFYKDFLSVSPNAGMVVSGSYLPGEDTGQVSRKLRLYKSIFYPWLNNLGLIPIEIFNLNAFIMVGKDTKLSQEDYLNNYITFKKKGHGNA